MLTCLPAVATTKRFPTRERELTRSGCWYVPICVRSAPLAPLGSQHLIVLSQLPVITCPITSHKHSVQIILGTIRNTTMLKADFWVPNKVATWKIICPQHKCTKKAIINRMTSSSHQKHICIKKVRVHLRINTIITTFTNLQHKNTQHIELAYHAFPKRPLCQHWSQFWSITREPQLFRIHKTYYKYE